MILKLFEDKPDYFVIAWDAPQKTVRHEMFSEYKANRSATPDDFKSQIKIIKPLIEKLGIPSLETPGYEADDIIGTLAKKAEGNDLLQTIIFSSDKDLKQVLSDTCVFNDPMKQILTKPKDFVIEYGFEPILIVDYLALVWDASDNIPGVRGIGKKWASKLIQKYGDLDNIYANIEEITGSTKQKLIDWKDAAYHSKKLIQLIDVPGLEGADFEDFSYKFNFIEMEKDLIHYYKFMSMQKLLDKLKKIMQKPEQLSLFG